MLDIEKDTEKPKRVWKWWYKEVDILEIVSNLGKKEKSKSYSQRTGFQLACGAFIHASTNYPSPFST